MRKLVESTFVTLDGVIGEAHIWGMPCWDARSTTPTPRR